jgi:CubicO group peptidase (beta-lactamase class C family)
VHARLAPLVDVAFRAPSAELGESHALLIVAKGAVAFERYAEPFTGADTFRSWSIAKSITHALTGLVVLDGLVDIQRPADVPAWREDARCEITLDHLLRMSSGLAWNEDERTGEPWHLQAMLFGEGQADMAAYAAARPLAHRPGTHFAYCSGGTNLIAACLARATRARGPAFRDFMRQRLFGPLGMQTPKPRWDGAGTFNGSSFCRMSARDFARFGLFYLRDGVWEGRRLLPEGWVDYARTPTFQQPGSDAEGRYGAHWWLGFGGPGSFAAIGAEGQTLVCVPDLDLVVVRHGVTPHAQRFSLHAWIADVVACFRERAAA